MTRTGSPAARYDRIGHGYARTRREDPAVKARLVAALGDARSVLNVGAGTGSYEPADRLVIPLEPSSVMAAQRPANSLPALRATAHAIPLHDDSVDAAMTILSLHHWDGHQEQGVREMCRVARDRVVILTIDPEVSVRMWLMADYLHEVAALDARTCPLPAEIAEWIGNARVEIMPISRGTPDWTLMSFWAHPERVLNADARAATSGFARQSSEVVNRVVCDVRRDLESGAWDERHGHLRSQSEFDAGLRLIVRDVSR